ncbi:MAG: arginine--tRNA ligase, partial [Patescibacteria group bacterium]
MNALKDAILAAYKAACNGLSPDAPEVELRRTPNPTLGDLAFNCAPMAKTVGQNPAEFAQRVAQAISTHNLVAEAKQVGAYVNIRFSPTALFQAAIEIALAKDAKFVTGTRRIMVEYMSPNTNKPLHLGHLRNGCLGSALANILEAVGHFVVRACLVNDRGVHICKSMLVWQRWAEGATPESTGQKGDHFVGDWYVRYAQEAKEDPSLEVAIHDMLLKWEAGDSDTLNLWQTMKLPFGFWLFLIAFLEKFN